MSLGGGCGFLVRLYASLNPQNSNSHVQNEGGVSPLFKEISRIGGRCKAIEDIIKLAHYISINACSSPYERTIFSLKIPQRMLDSFFKIYLAWNERQLGRSRKAHYRFDSPRKRARKRPNRDVDQVNTCIPNLEISVFLSYGTRNRMRRRQLEEKRPPGDVPF